MTTLRSKAIRLAASTPKGSPLRTALVNVLGRYQEYRVVDGSGYQPGHTPRNKRDAEQVAEQFNGWVQWQDPETGDWVTISKRGGEPLPRFKWRVSLY